MPVEPALAQLREAGREIAREQRLRTEVDIARKALIVVAVRPRAEDQPQRAAFAPAQLDVVVGRGARVRVVPRRHPGHRHVAELRVPALGVDALPLPEAVEAPGLPLVEHVVLVLGHQAQRRVAARPRHVGEPRAQVDRAQRRELRGIGAHLRRFQHRVERPGRLLELERTALADAALVRVREAAGIEEQCGDAGRVRAGERGDRVRAVREALRADPAVAPRLAHEPGAAVVAVGAVAQIFDVRAAGVAAAAAVLEHDRVAVAREQARDRAARVAQSVLRLAVGRALEDHRERARERRVAARGQIDVGREHHAVAHRHVQVALHEHVVRAALLVGRCEPRQREQRGELQEAQAEGAARDHGRRWRAYSSRP